MHEESVEYYRARERIELAAAETAATPEARRAHEKMAQAYAELVQAREVHRVSPARSR